MMEKKLLSIQKLCAWYDRKKPVLSDFSLELAEHEVVGLIGLNGAGKTTFLKVLSGVHEGFCAEQLVMDTHAVDFSDRAFQRQRYTVFAEDASFSYFTFREYLTYVCKVYGVAQPDISELIAGFHFGEYTDVLMKDLSMGNRKKVFLITAFALKPRLLLLDEPVNGLDFASTEYLYQLMARYREHGTLLFSSHILESITLTCDRVLVLEEGRIRESFSQGEIDAAGIREALVV